MHRYDIVSLNELKVPVPYSYLYGVEVGQYELD
jgi:hypothetical protein